MEKVNSHMIVSLKKDDKLKPLATQAFTLLIPKLGEERPPTKIIMAKLSTARN